MVPQNALQVMDLRDNTFYDEFGVDIEMWPTPTAQLSWINNIFAPGPTNLRCSAGTVIQYNVFQGGVGLAACHPIDQTNLLIDPLMCNANWFSELDGFELNSNSPCIGAGEGGSTIGALGIGCGLTGVGDVTAPGAERMRLEVVPNPIRARTEFRITGAADPTALEIYDSAGRVVDIIKPGRAPYVWEPSSSVLPGVYFVRLRAHEGSATSKFVVLPK